MNAGTIGVVVPTTAIAALMAAPSGKMGAAAELGFG